MEHRFGSTVVSAEYINEGNIVELSIAKHADEMYSLSMVNIATEDFKQWIDDMTDYLLENTNE